MPFEVFRRHQKKMLAALAIMAMIAFTLDFSLFSDRAGGPRDDPKVVDLYGRAVYQSDLAEMAQQRDIANAFMGRLVPGLPGQFFGGTTTRELVDALILDHEADAL